MALCYTKPWKPLINRIGDIVGHVPDGNAGKNGGGS